LNHSFSKIWNAKVVEMRGKVVKWKDYFIGEALYKVAKPKVQFIIYKKKQYI
jgi:hypothetical protein